MAASAGVPLVEAAGAPLLARPYYAQGDPGPIVAALAHVPEVLEVAMPFLSVILGPSSISLRRKEIVILRTSALAACRYCVTAHSAAAVTAGLSVIEVRGLRGELPVEDVFPDAAERQLLAWVDVVAQPGAVSAGQRAALRQYLATHELVEVTLLVGATLMLNRFCTALDLLPDRDSVAQVDETVRR